MNAEADGDALLDVLYEAPTSPDRWQSALAHLARWAGANEFHLLRWNKPLQRPVFNVHSKGIEAAIEQYGAHYASIDPRRMLVASGPPGQVSACQHHFDERYVARSEFYQDFLDAWDMRRSMSCLIVDDGEDQLMLGLVRARERGLFEQERIDRLERVMPHLRRACRIWMDVQRLQEKAALGDQANGSVGLAWMALDAVGTVMHASLLAESLLRGDDSLVLRAGRLHATHAGDAARLQSAIAQAARGQPASEFTVSGRRSGPHACTVSVIGAAKSSLTEAAVLVMVRQRDALRAPSAEQLMQAFGLTPAESKVALALMGGKTPVEHAEAAGLSIATVRTHLSAIFAKTCTRRQAEAVQVLRDLQFR